MKEYTLFETKGNIAEIVGVLMSYDDGLPETFNYVQGFYSKDNYYFVNEDFPGFPDGVWLPEERPENTATLSKTQVAVNEVIDITVPVPSILWIEDVAYEVASIEQLVFDTPKTYEIRVESFPHKPKTFEVTVS
jgi:hypothetical protein